MEITFNLRELFELVGMLVCFGVPMVAGVAGFLLLAEHDPIAPKKWKK